MAGTADRQDVPIRAGEDAALRPIQIADMGAHARQNPMQHDFRIGCAPPRSRMSPGLIRPLPELLPPVTPQAWAKHVADDFVAFAEQLRAAGAIEPHRRHRRPQRQRRHPCGRMEDTRLAVYGEGAVMVATEANGPQPADRRAFL